MLALWQYRKRQEAGQDVMNPIKYLSIEPILIALAGMRLIHGQLGHLMVHWKGLTLGIFSWPALMR